MVGATRALGNLSVKSLEADRTDERGLQMRMILMAAMALAPLLANGAEPAKRLEEARAVFSEIMATPDKGIPVDLLAKAHCIVVVPGLKKVAFVVGGEYGSGYLSCRNKSGMGWSAPGSVRIKGGSVGFQIGGSETDLIMLVMNQGGADKLLSDKFTVGADASVAAGPVGRLAAAQTDAELHAEILSWSRTQGVFAGVSLEGATLQQDLKENQAIYHRSLDNRRIVTTGIRVPKIASGLIGLLDKDSVREVASTSVGSN
jgi:lipid-binding SYLF domain-containing protein